MRSRARRRALSLTPLIDVIFLLLLFFMLSSTFSRFADVEMTVGGAPAAAPTPDGLAFLRLGAAGLALNGVPLADPAGLVPRLGALGVETLAVSVDGAVSSQRLTDLLVAMRAAPDIRVVLLGGR